MEKNQLAPFDAECVMMIENITKRDTEVILKKEYIIIYAFCHELNEEQRSAMEDAVRGRFGKRIKDVEFVRTINAVVFLVNYSDDYDKLPFVEGYPGCPAIPQDAGRKYCLKLREVWAVRFTREQMDRVKDFTGGGTFAIPRTPGGLAQYAFINLKGLNVDATEGDWIVYDNDFRVYSNAEFLRMYEPKFGRIMPIEEMNDRFGTNLYPRCKKLAEEYHEFMEVLAQSGTMTNEEFLGRFLDELSDMNAVIYHIASILGKTQTELLEMAGDKIEGRFKDPNYKRIHPHKE